MSDSTVSDTLDGFDGLLNWPALSDWIEAQSGVPGQGPVTAVEKMTAGLSNAVFLLHRGATSIVLRRPSKRGKPPKSNEIMLKEARILRALEGSNVPHPELYAVCDDESVTGACFYLMSPLEGMAKSGALEGEYATNPAWRRAMGEELVKAAVALGDVDVEAVGLSDLGKPENWHARQVERWRSQLEGYAATPGYNPNDLPHFAEIGRWLSDNIPDNRRIGIVHGDFQFPNVMFSLKAPIISGVLDWELTSLGDPLMDLGWVLSSWWEDGDPEGKGPMVTPWDGFMSRAELIDLYGSLSGRDMSCIPWYFALSCYKLACLLEGTTAAWKAGKVPDKVGESVHAYATWLTTKARRVAFL
jgi:aminoglycoside phosphotransferase (APT) family kinase protein